MALAQAETPGLDAQASELYFGSHFPPDRDAQRRLVVAQQLIEEGRFSAAAEQIHSVLIQPADALSAAGESLHAQARGRLASGPPELGRAYTTLQEPEAERQLLSAATSSDVARLASRYPLEGVGRSVWVAWARAAADEGRHDLAGEIWQALIERYGDASPVDWRVRASTSAEADDRFAEPTKSLSASRLSPDAQVAVSWSTDPAPETSDVRRARRAPIRFPSGGFAVSEAGLLVRLGGDLIACDRSSGKRKWAVEGLWLRPAATDSKRAWRSLVDAIAVDSRYGYAVVDAARSSAASASQRRDAPSGNRLVALDLARDGALVWSSDTANRASGASARPHFLCAPVFTPRGLATLAYSEGAIALVLYDQRAGRMVWRQPLVEIDDDPESNRPLAEYGGAIASDGHRLYCATGAGVLACVDLLRSEIVWLARYPIDQEEYDSARSQSRRRALLGVVGDDRTTMWRRPRLCLAPGLVIVASPESRALTALDRLDGDRRWGQRLSDPLDVAGRNHEELLVLARGRLIALDAATGAERGAVSLITADAQPVEPAGPGMIANDRYWLTTRDRRLVSVRLPLSLSQRGVTLHDHGEIGVAGATHAIDGGLIVHSDTAATRVGRAEADVGSRLENVARRAQARDATAAIELCARDVYVADGAWIVAPERLLAGVLAADPSAEEAAFVDEAISEQRVDPSAAARLIDAIADESFRRAATEQWLAGASPAIANAASWQAWLIRGAPTEKRPLAKREQAHAFAGVDVEVKVVRAEAAPPGPTLNGREYNDRPLQWLGEGRLTVQPIGDDRWRLLALDESGQLVSATPVYAGVTPNQPTASMAFGRFQAASVGGRLQVYDRGERGRTLTPLWSDEHVRAHVVASVTAGGGAVSRRKVAAKSLGRLLAAGRFGLVTAHTASERDEVVCRRWTDGRVLWRRSVAPSARAVAADDRLYLDGPRRTGSEVAEPRAVLSWIDGSEAGRWKPPAGRWLADAAGNAATEVATPEGSSVIVVDVATGERLVELATAGGVASVLVGGDRGEPLVAVLVGPNEVAIVDVAAGAVRFTATLGELPPDGGYGRASVRSLVARRHAGSLLIALRLGRGPEERLPIPGAPLVVGRLWRLDATTGESLWPGPVRLDGQCWIDPRFEAAPVLLFGYGKASATRGAAPEIHLLALDAATGRWLAPIDPVSTRLNEVAQVRGDYDRSFGSRVRLTFGPIRCTLSATSRAAAPAPPFDESVESPAPGLGKLLRSAGAMMDWLAPSEAAGDK
ncbi:MAG: PQQ-binding-like beta-propeller repeat protein [Planctomycetota bacterium]